MEYDENAPLSKLFELGNLIDRANKINEEKSICTCMECLEKRIKGLRKYNIFISTNYVNHIIECIKSNNITPVITIAESVAPDVCKYYTVSSTEEFFISYPVDKHDEGYLTIYKLIEGKKYVDRR